MGLIRAFSSRRDKTASLLPWLLAGLLLSQGQLSGTVLCFGADGHIAVELATRRCCCCGSSSKVVLPEASSSLQEQSHCERCMDLAIPSITLSKPTLPAQDRTPRNEAPALATPIFLQSLPVEIASASFSALSFANTFFLPYRRTVVLLI